MERAGWDALARGEGQHRLRRRTKGTVAQLPGCVPAPRKGVSRPAPVLAAIVGRRTLAATRRPSGRAQVAVLRRSLPACLCVKVKDKTFQRKYSIHPRVPPASLAGVSRSVTLVVAYIMTVTDLGWEDALRTVRAGRSCANPNLGFQRQLQEFEERQVHQFRQWLKEEYGESPLRDAEEARGILATPGILKDWAPLRRL
eukprot:XP_028334247.1 dual specificity protein phosphatase 22 isoform X2 [Physeter catodon]